MPRHRLPGIGEQVPLFVALPSSLPVRKDTYRAVLWFKTGWDVSDKVYRKAGHGANGGGDLFHCDKDLLVALGFWPLAFSFSDPLFRSVSSALISGKFFSFPIRAHPR